MEPQLPGLLATPDRMIDLAPPHIIADMDRLRDAFHEAVEPDALLLIGRRHVRSNNSWMHNLNVLTKGKDRCTMLVHPQDASSRGLESRSEEHTSELQLLMRISYAVFCLKKKKNKYNNISKHKCKTTLPHT